ncbi:MAG: signal recognition particle-docking protein FtsY [Chloroflexota bacterium]|nr:signal recognition particle-docking protein FtsY [Chloroflexota bacterium]
MGIFDKVLKRSKESWFSKVANLFERSTAADVLGDDLEELLISADVGVGTTMALLDNVRARARSERLQESSQVYGVLKQEMERMLEVTADSNKPGVGSAKPWVILVVGVNGTGKTLSIAKMANIHIKQGKKVVIAAADTFRAAAIEQIRILGDRVGADVVYHKSGADPGAVVFDSMEAAKARGVDVLIIDTAGRLHTKFNLMEELKKVRRIIERSDSSAPHEVYLVMDATTGQNGLAQAKYFTEAVDVTGIILTKLDGTSKGGIVLAICDDLKIPILFIGTGEGVDDIALFDAHAFIEELSS